jgi:DNA-binding SARP family transcriptional activator/tetratricopeptide (TPR) repeat protein
METVRLDLLGPPVLRVAGEQQAVETRKALGLLAYVVVEGPQDRGALDGLFWPESDAQRARATLRRTLTALRRVLPSGVLADGDEVALAAPIDVDLDEVERLLGDGRATQDPATLAAADALHRGEFLAGLWFRDADPFEHWRRDTAEYLSRRHARLLEGWCGVHVARGEFPEAIEVAGRRLAMDPLHEAAHQQLMLLHAWRGDRAAAARQYATCARVLDEELGVAPLPRTTALDRAIRAGTVEPPPRTAPDPAPAPVRELVEVRSVAPAEVPFVGRGHELGQLGALHRGRTDDGALALVVGEAGIGKTRLVAELAAAVDAPLVRLEARAGEASLAYAPVTAALRTIAPDVRELEGAVRTELARLAPDVAGIPAPSEPLHSPGARTRLLDACATAVTAPLVGGETPGLLVVEDLDQADAETLQLVAYLARRLSGRPILVVVTCREAVDLPHVDLRLDLPRLAVDDIRQLATARGAAEAADRLHRESEGVPFLVVSYLAALTAGATGWELPGGWHELVRSRLERLDEVARQVLAAAAVLGGAPTLDVLGHVSGRAEDELVDAVEALTAAGVLMLGEDGTCRLTHDKLRTVVLDDLSPVRRRLLHRRAADGLARSPIPVPAATLAHHLGEAGQEAEAAAAHARAGTRAAELYANDAAIDHLETALALGHGEAAALLLTLGDLHVRTGQYPTAANRYTRAGSRGAALDVVEERLGALALRRGDDDAAEAHLAAALTADPPTERRVVVLAELAQAQIQRGDLAAAAERAVEAVALADTEEVPRAARARAHNVAGLVARRRGQLGDARRHLQASLAVAPGAEQRAAALNNLALVLGEDGELDEALVVARDALEAGRAASDRHREAALLSNLADLLHAAGRTEEALGLQGEAAERFAGVDEAPTTSPEIWRLVDW